MSVTQPDPSLARTQAPAGEALTHPGLVLLFLLCLTQPYNLQVGPLLIGPYQMILLLTGPIFFLRWITGAYGGVRLPDVMILAFSLWVPLTLAMNGQSGRLVEWGGAYFVDTFFGYLFGRAVLRHRQDFYFFARVLLVLLLILLPFAFLESIMGIVLVNPIAGVLPLVETFNSVTLTYERRFGFFRAQVSAPHPILFGVMCSTAFSMAFVGLSRSGRPKSFFGRALLAAGSGFGTMFSWSAGAYLSVMTQGGLMLWNYLLRSWQRRWIALAWLTGLFFVFVSLVSERSPIFVLARMLAFNSSTAWNRMLIWQYGTDEVGRNPIFGMGVFDDWIREAWMSSSIDNFWLLVAMRHGLPGIFLLLGAGFYIVTKLARMRLAGDPELAAIRDCFAFTFAGLFLALFTVAVWNIQYSMVLILMGGAVWIYTSPPPPDAEQAEAEAEANATARAATGRYSRFPVRHRRPTGRPGQPAE